MPAPPFLWGIFCFVGGVPPYEKQKRESALCASTTSDSLFYFSHCSMAFAEKVGAAFPPQKAAPCHDQQPSHYSCKVLASPCQKNTCKAPLCASHVVNNTTVFGLCQSLFDILHNKHFSLSSFLHLAVKFLQFIVLAFLYILSIYILMFKFQIKGEYLWDFPLILKIIWHVFIRF